MNFRKVLMCALGFFIFVGGASDVSADPKLKTGRYGAAAANVGDVAYIIGGSGPEHFLGDIERINLRTGIVSRMNTSLQPRRYHTAEAVDGRIYVLGGYDSALVSTLEIYDSQTDAITYGPPLPTPRYFASSAVLGNRIYVVGGSFLRRDSRPTPIVEIFDIAKNRWESGPPLAVGRQAEVVAFDGRLYAIGGYDGIHATRIVEVLDPAEGKWRRLSDLPFSMSAHRAVAAGNRIYTFGDYYEMDRVWSYDPEKDEWDVLVTGYRPARHASAVSVSDTIAIIGGNISTAGTHLDEVQIIPLGALVSDARTGGVGPWIPRQRDTR